VADHVALAIEDGQSDETVARHGASLTHLLQVSLRLGQTRSIDAMLQSVADGIRRALSTSSASPSSLRIRARAGSSPGRPRVGDPAGRRQASSA
jgi:hypothetical protein